MALHPTAHWRRDYRSAELDELHCPDEPWPLFDTWLAEAKEAGEPEANAVSLATVDRDGWPDARIVLLKGYDEQGFTFFSNYNSAKGMALAATERASLCFWWPVLQRQVRAQGSVAQLSTAAADLYFASRPRDSQLAAWASQQSEVLPDRAELEERFFHAQQRFAGQVVDRPAHWGGWLLQPRRVEFWQGRPNRLHDRVSYRAVEEGWLRQRLAP